MRYQEGKVPFVIMQFFDALPVMHAWTLLHTAVATCFSPQLMSCLIRLSRHPYLCSPSHHVTNAPCQRTNHTP